MSAKDTVTQLLQKADVKINGDRPWDIQVHNGEVYKRVLREGSLGLGESYMDGWWDVEQLDEFFHKILSTDIQRSVALLRLVPIVLKTALVNRQTKKRSRRVAEGHYDLGNDLYEAMLGKTMQYTCAYWKNAQSLDEAQEAKLDLVCRKLYLKPGMTVLELGSGFGMFAKYAAEKYGCEVTTYNISEEQVKYAREISKGLPVTVMQDDYRNATGMYDRVVSIGLLEHVGAKNYQDFFDVAAKCLKPDGLLLTHCIGKTTASPYTDPWITKYIFPGGMIPGLRQLLKHAERSFIVEDLHNFGPDYDPTLMGWYDNFVANWDDLKGSYEKRFYRMWTYYLQACAGAFRARSLQLWQIVYTKGNEGTYRSVR